MRTSFGEEYQTREVIRG